MLCVSFADDVVSTSPPSAAVDIPLYDWGFYVLVSLFIFLLVVLIGYQSDRCKKNRENV